VPPQRDNLQRIGGINAEIEKLLGVQGISRYGQVAGWSSADIERFDRLLGSQGRIARENWVEQAQILAKGGDTAHSRAFDRRASETPRETGARPKSISDAIKANAAATPAAAAAARPDIGGLRSVRSDAYRPSASAAENAATAAAAAAAAGAGSARVVRSAEIDDLKRIRGIGVLIEKRLNSVGVVSYGQIAEWTTEDIDRVSSSLDFKGRIERENWVEQARILASGGQTEFSRRVDRGEVETSRPKT
jgi:predicted flap endonuclease-1-like 5' DNA nuclease